jgi:hypothetical protein
VAGVNRGAGGAHEAGVEIIEVLGSFGVGGADVVLDGRMRSM